MCSVWFYIGFVSWPTVFVDTCNTVDLYLILDNSGSINKIDPNNWQYMLNFSTEYVGSVPLGSYRYQVGVVWYGNRGTVKIPLNYTNDKTNLTSTINLLRFNKRKTNLVAGLNATVSEGFQEWNGARQGAYKAAIVLWDGEEPNEEFGDAVPYASMLRESGVEVFVLTLTGHLFSAPNDTFWELMQEIPSLPLHQHGFILNSYSELSTYVLFLRDTIWQSCMTNGLPPGGPIPNQPPPGWHQWYLLYIYQFHHSWLRSSFVYVYFLRYFSEQWFSAKRTVVLLCRASDTILLPAGFQVRGWNSFFQNVLRNGLQMFFPCRLYPEEGCCWTVLYRDLIPKDAFQHPAFIYSSTRLTHVFSSLFWKIFIISAPNFFPLGYRSFLSALPNVSVFTGDSFALYLQVITKLSRHLPGAK